MTLGENYVDNPHFQPTPQTNSNNLPYGLSSYRVLLPSDSLPTDKLEVRQWVAKQMRKNNDSFREHERRTGTPIACLCRMRKSGYASWFTVGNYLIATRAPERIWKLIYGLQTGAYLYSTTVNDDNESVVYL